MRRVYAERLRKVMYASLYVLRWVICGLLRNHRANGSGTLRAESRHDPAWCLLQLVLVKPQWAASLRWSLISCGWTAYCDIRYNSSQCNHSGRLPCGGCGYHVHGCSEGCFVCFGGSSVCGASCCLSSAYTSPSSLWRKYVLLCWVSENKGCTISVIAIGRSKERPRENSENQCDEVNA